MATTKETQILDALDKCLVKYGHQLGPRETALCQRVYTPPLQRYTDRLKAIQYTGMERVLDACSGFGQWTLALADLNQHVDACDISPDRMAIVDMLGELSGANNIDVKTCKLEALAYDDNTFDAAFCYVSLPCTPWKESLKELYRVLKPGGKVYFTANGLGYHVHMWVDEPHKTVHRSPRYFTALSLKNTLEYEEHGKAPEQGQIVVEKDEMRDCLHENGFRILALEDEGCIDMTNGKNPPESFFPGEYNGLTCCYEVLAEK